MSINKMSLLLMGDAGVGKTTAIKTWIDAGITPFCVFTEPSYEVLGHLPEDKIHWHYLPPATADWKSMWDTADKINKMSYENLCKLDGINKKEYRDFMKFIDLMNNYVCQRTGEEFGCVDTWGTDRVLVLDSFTGLCTMGMNLVVGSKPTKAKQDYGMAMDNVLRLVQRIIMGTPCHFMMTGHMEREPDEVVGGQLITLGAIGQKLAPKIPPLFSDVVMAKRDANKFSWSTIHPNATLKARNLDYAEGITPSVVPLVEKWKSQGGVIAAGKPQEVVV